MEKAKRQFYRILLQAGESAARAFAKKVGCAAVVQRWLDEDQLEGLNALPGSSMG